jgi:hypothetical protein
MRARGDCRDALQGPRKPKSRRRIDSLIPFVARRNDASRSGTLQRNPTIECRLKINSIRGATLSIRTLRTRNGNHSFLWTARRASSDTSGLLMVRKTKAEAIGSAWHRCKIFFKKPFYAVAHNGTLRKRAKNELLVAQRSDAFIRNKPSHATIHPL